MKTLQDLRQNIKEADRKSIVVSHGRFNPPTKGHGKLIDTVLKHARGREHRIYLSQSQDSKTNPLSYNEKIKYARLMFPQANIVKDNSVKHIFDVIEKLEKEGYDNVVLVFGGDRAKEFEKAIKKFPPKMEWKIVSSGERNPSSRGVAGVSSSKMREAAKNKNYRRFKLGLPKGFPERAAMEMFNAVRKGLNLKPATFYKAGDVKVVEDFYSNARHFTPDGYMITQIMDEEKKSTTMAEPILRKRNQGRALSLEGKKSGTGTPHNVSRRSGIEGARWGWNPPHHQIKKTRYEAKRDPDWYTRSVGGKEDEWFHYDTSQTRKLLFRIGNKTRKRDLDVASGLRTEDVVESLNSNGAYVYYTVAKPVKEKLYQWMKDNDIPNPVPKDSLHCTVAYGDSVDPNYHFSEFTLSNEIVVADRKTYRLEVFGDALVIAFRNHELNKRNSFFNLLGLRSKFTTYIPHITVSYGFNGSIPLKNINIPDFDIVLDREHMVDPDPDWTSKVEENLDDPMQDPEEGPGSFKPKSKLVPWATSAAYGEGKEEDPSQSKSQEKSEFPPKTPTFGFTGAEELEPFFKPTWDTKLNKGMRFRESGDGKYFPTNNPTRKVVPGNGDDFDKQRHGGFHDYQYPTENVEWLDKVKDHLKKKFGKGWVKKLKSQVWE